MAVRALGSARDRAGFALPMALWGIVLLSAVVMSLVTSARTEQRALFNRIERTRLVWQAEGCLSRLLARIEGALDSSVDAEVAWLGLDQLWRRSEAPAVGCRIHGRALGARISLVRENDATLGAVLSWLTGSVPRADSLVQALRDWEDPDQERRPLGAEASWYQARNLPTPRNGSIGDLEELALVRGFDAIDDPGRWFSLDDAPLALNHLPVDLLRVLPEVDRELRRDLVALRRGGRMIRDLDVLETPPWGLPDDARRARNRFRNSTVLSPVGWLITVEVEGSRVGTQLVMGSEIRLERGHALVAYRVDRVMERGA